MSFHTFQARSVVCWQETPAIAPRVIVVRDGRIHALLPAGSAQMEQYPAPTDLGDALITPGLVNAHVHLELSLCRADPLQGMRFADWILSMRERMQMGDGDPDDYFRRATQLGASECLRCGVTSVGDISQYNHLTRPILQNGPLRVTSYGEVLGLALAKPRFEKLLQRATETSAASEYLRVGLSPHAPYTVDRDGFEQCVSLAKQRGYTLATHLAETPEEEAFLRDHTGPFREIWERIGSWSDDVVTDPTDPIRMAEHIGLLDVPAVLAHVNYCSDEQLQRLARGRASVVYCPRTHRYFGHSRHRFRDMMRTGINVAIGTDSRASSPDLNLMDDLRLVRQLAPDLPAAEIWKMGTLHGAQAINDPLAGDVRVGGYADFVAWPVKTGDPLQEILTTALTPAQVWIAGNPVL